MVPKDRFPTSMFTRAVTLFKEREYYALTRSFLNRFFHFVRPLLRIPSTVALTVLQERFMREIPLECRNLTTALRVEKRPVGKRLPVMYP